MPLEKERPPAWPIQREKEHQAVLRESLSDDFDVETLLETDDSLSYRANGIGSDVLRRLRRGHWSIQSEIDLHGLRRDEARQALSDFIRSAHHAGLRCVRVIHGKGLGSANKTPVLKSKAQSWLIQKREVIAFVQARPADGGSGALVVLLRGRS
jgi:DNA-nicking Smr family endonuclease